MSTLDLDHLQRPLPVWHPKAWYFALARGALNTVGRLSLGVQIGQRFGFDSGVMLDHVYCNRARGTGFLGRAIDRAYLNAPGWAGIRSRGALLRSAVCSTVRDLAPADGRPVRVADLACGGAQYVLDALAELHDVPVAAVLRDYREENVLRAASNAEARGVQARIERADAFSDRDIAELGALDLVIVSGLHEIISEDALVHRHFRQIADRLEPGGVLLVTVQPHHPQLEFIARTLTSHTGRAWAMRLRSVDLVTQWAAEAGLELQGCEMEPRGIFGVAKFRRH